MSPFVNLPAATTLSYNYKAMPSALPPSATGVAAAGPSEDGTGTGTPQPQDPKPQYVVSQSGHAAHPDDIIASCRALQGHISRMQEDAERELREFEERIRARELAEKRKVAPGWLDSEARILEPERKTPASAGPGSAGDASGDGAAAGGASGDGPAASSAQGPRTQADTDQGAELDRMFGGMSVQ